MKSSPLRANQHYLVIAAAIVVAAIVMATAVYISPSSSERTTVTVTTTTTASPTAFVSVSTLTVNGSLYFADNVTEDTSVLIPGYTHFLNGSVTFLGVKFETYCPSTIVGCAAQPGTNATTQVTEVMAGVIRLNITFQDKTVETIGGVINTNPYFFIFSQHRNPQAGILIVSTSSAFKAYLLMT